MRFCVICNQRYLDDVEFSKKTQERRYLFKDFVDLFEIPRVKVRHILDDYCFRKRTPYCRKCTQWLKQIMPLYHERERRQQQVSDLQAKLLIKLRELEEVATKVNGSVKKMRRLAKESDLIRRDEIKAVVEHKSRIRAVKEAKAEGDEDGGKKKFKSKKLKYKTTIELSDEVVEQTLRDLIIQADLPSKGEREVKIRLTKKVERLMEGYPVNFAVTSYSGDMDPPKADDNSVGEPMDLELQEIKEELIDSPMNYENEEADGSLNYHNENDEQVSEGEGESVQNNRVELSEEDGDISDYLNGTDDKSELETRNELDASEDENLELGWFAGGKASPDKPRSTSGTFRSKKKDKKGDKIRPLRRNRAKPKGVDDTPLTISRESLRKRPANSSKKSKFRTGSSDSDLFSSEDGSDVSDDSEWSDSDDQMGEKQGQRWKEHQIALENERNNFQLRYDEFLGEAETTSDGKTMYKGTEIIDKGDGTFACGLCQKQSAKNSNTPVAIQIAKRYIKRHIMEDHLGGYACRVCPPEKADRRYKNMKCIMMHELRHTAEFVYCDICGKPYKIGTSLKWHFWSHKSEQDRADAIAAGIEPPKPPSKSKSNRVQCTQCGRMYDSAYALKTHEQVHLSKEQRDSLRIPCHLCGKMYYRHSLAPHLQLTHGKGCYSCTLCEPTKYFKTKNAIRMHTRKAHDNEPPPFACDVCDFKSFSNYKMKTHVRSVHLKERPFECEQCQARFSCKKNLSRHLKTVHAGDKPAKPKKRKQRQSSDDSPQDSGSEEISLGAEPQGLPTPHSTAVPLSTATNAGYQYEPQRQHVPVAVPGTYDYLNWTLQDYANAHLQD